MVGVHVKIFALEKHARKLVQICLLVCGILQDVIAEILIFACWVILHAVLSSAEF